MATASSASARRYAEAVFELAADSDAIEQWSSDLRSLADFTAETDVARMLQSARAPKEQKERLLRAGLEGQVSAQAMNLARLLNDRNKIGLAAGIQRRFQELADERAGIAHATVTTAVALSDDERRQIEGRLSSMTGKRVDVTPVVDESIIGGIVARIGDQLIDGSTRTKLVALKRRLAGAAR